MHPNTHTIETFSKKLLENHPFSNIKVIEMLGGGKVLVENKYGICKPKIQNLLKQGSCSIRVSVNKTEYFINQAREIHGELYDYSKTVYVDEKTKLTIICKIHGEFEQFSYKHLIQKGCILCGFEERKKNKTSTSESFIKKAIKIHGETYNYSKVIYKTAKSKLIITCKIHGDFLQNPNNHLNGQGCNKCGVLRASELTRKDLNTFIKQANTFHKNKYDYSISEYLNTDKKLTIICPIHGKFEQTPSAHLRTGCNKCGNLKISEAQKKLNNGWSYSTWEKKGNKSQYFDSFKVYIIKCYNEDEEFYKIGRTYNKLTRRFSCKSVLPYNYEVIKIIKGSAKIISKLENKLHKMHLDYYYEPKLYFEGSGECFSLIDMNIVKEICNTWLKTHTISEEELELLQEKIKLI